MDNYYHLFIVNLRGWLAGLMRDLVMGDNRNIVLGCCAGRNLLKSNKIHLNGALMFRSGIIQLHLFNLPDFILPQSYSTPSSVRSSSSGSSLALLASIGEIAVAGWVINSRKINNSFRGPRRSPKPLVVSLQTGHSRRLCALE